MTATEGGLDPREEALDHAWKWFEYHAGQRQAVFRFFVLMAGAISTGYLATENSATGDLKSSSYIFGGLLVAISFLFWRLDVRSIDLIKLAERHLQTAEERLAADLQSEEIEFVKNADDRSGVPCLLRLTYSFRQIYRIVFLLAALSGAYIFIAGDHSPVWPFLARIF